MPEVSPQSRPGDAGSSAAARSGRGRRLLWRGVFLLASSLLGLGLMEVAVREFFPVRGTIYQPDALRLHQHLPGARKTYRHLPANGGQWVLVRINREGRRGEPAAPPDVPKVLVYGDSFISAEFSRLDKTFVAQLEARLNSGGRARVQVLNCGVTAYGPDQAALCLARDLEVLKPRLVVFSIYAGNDFGDLLRNKLLKLDADGRLAANAPTLAPALRKQFEDARALPRLHLVRAFQSALQRHRSAGETPPPPGGGANVPLMESWLAQRAGEHHAYVELGDNSVVNLFEDGYDADVSLEPSSASAGYRRRLMARLLEHVRGLAAAHAVPLVVMVIPAPFDVVEGYEPRPDAGAHPEYRPAGLADLVEDMARELRIPCLNLFRPFQQAGAARLYYTAGNDHWNDAGQQEAAELMTRFIRENGLLAP